MAMHLGPGEGSDEPDVVFEINTTPLIDVMLVLLIMLIVTIPIQTHAVKLDMPSGPPPAAAPPPVVVSIEITAEGIVHWNQDTVADGADLSQRLAAAASMPTQPEMHVRPDKHVAYGHVAAVLAAIQRAGLSRLGIING